MAKQTYYGFSQFLFKVLEWISTYFIKSKRILWLKLKISIFILAFKGNQANAQVGIRGTGCYKINRPMNDIDFSVSDRFSISNFQEHTMKINAGYSFKTIYPGVSFQYFFSENSIGLGPYVRAYTFRSFRWWYHFIELNYQFGLQNQPFNQFNASTGFLVGPYYNIGIEVACEYSYVNSKKETHTFMPAVGIHYYLVHPRPKIF